MQKPTRSFWNRAFVTAASFALITTLAWVLVAFLFVLRMWDPAIREVPPIRYYPVLAVCLLPWLSACACWVRARRGAASGGADRGGPGACYQAVFTVVAAAYLAVLSVGLLLLQATAGTK